MNESHYEVPQVEVIEVEVEQGFAGSNTIIGGDAEQESMGGSGTGTFPW